MAKSDYLHMRIDPELKAEIRNEAKRRHIDASALVSLVMTEWLEKNRKKSVDASVIDAPAANSDKPVG
jgi:antitoxin component of RelBE/YafQ-DinJ toxin-antitoxin module